ncbi:hypothetical protein [Colwellia echini]|nr:hypothetical protein [Colwellia echini]
MQHLILAMKHNRAHKAAATRCTFMHVRLWLVVRLLLAPKCGVLKS